MLYGFGEYDEPPHSGEDDPIARHMSLWPEHRLCAIAPLWPLSDPTHPSPVVRHCSKNPIPGKTGIKTKIQELVLRLLCAPCNAVFRPSIPPAPPSLVRGNVRRSAGALGPPPRSLRRGRQSRHPAPRAARSGRTCLFFCLFLLFFVFMFLFIGSGQCHVSPFSGKAKRWPNQSWHPRGPWGAKPPKTIKNISRLLNMSPGDFTCDARAAIS
jgi:hypothetical protein